MGELIQLHTNTNLNRLYLTQDETSTRIDKKKNETAVSGNRTNIYGHLAYNNVITEKYIVKGGLF